MRAIISGTVGSMLVVGLVSAQYAVKPIRPSQDSKSEKEKPALPASAELAILDRYAGPWDVVEVHYNSRGDVVASTKGIEDGAWVLDGRTLRRTYTTGEEGNLFRAIGMITWDASEKRYEGTWFDNVSTNGPTSLSGAWDDASKTITFSLFSTAPDGKPAQYKVIDRFTDDEHHVATTYKVVGSQVEKVIEVQFARARPCPSNLSIIPENLAPSKP